jgi:hypothetical protein
MNNYNIKEYDNKSKGAYNRKTVRIAKKTNKTMSVDEVRQFYDTLIENGTEAEKINITVKTIDGRSLTLKHYDDDDIKPWDDEEYTKNKVKDNTKFREFLFVDFILK